MPTRFILDGDDVVRSSFWTAENLASLPVFVPFVNPGDVPKKGLVPAPPADTTFRVLGTTGWQALGQVNGIASLDANGKLTNAQIPDKTVEVLVTVANTAARWALTTAQVQNGDRVKQTSDNTFWELIDETNIGTDAGWTQIEPIAWADISGKPTTTFINHVPLGAFTGSAPVALAGNRYTQITGTFNNGVIEITGGFAGATVSVHVVATVASDIAVFLDGVERILAMPLQIGAGLAAVFYHDGTNWHVMNISKFEGGGEFIIYNGVIFQINSGELQVENTLVTFGTNTTINFQNLTSVLMDSASRNWFFTALTAGDPGGLATLDGNGKVPIAQIPDKAIEVTTTVADQAARLALTITQVQNGDRVFQTDTATYWELTNDAAINNVNSWLKRSPTDWTEITNKPTATFCDVQNVTLTSGTPVIVTISSRHTVVNVTSTTASTGNIRLTGGTHGDVVIINRKIGTSSNMSVSNSNNSQSIVSFSTADNDASAIVVRTSTSDIYQVLEKSTNGNIRNVSPHASVNEAKHSVVNFATAASAYFIPITIPPSDGETVVINANSTTYTFEWDNDVSVGGGNISVTIGSTAQESATNLAGAISSNVANSIAEALEGSTPSGGVFCSGTLSSGFTLSSASGTYNQGFVTIVPAENNMSGGAGSFSLFASGGVSVSAIGNMRVVLGPGYSLDTAIFFGYYSTSDWVPLGKIPASTAVGSYQLNQFMYPQMAYLTNVVVFDIVFSWVDLPTNGRMTIIGDGLNGVILTH